MTEVKFILVGLGARARVWRQVMQAHPACRIVGLVDTRAEAVAAALSDTPDAVGGATLAEVAGRVAADAVILSTPPGGRESQIAAACQAHLAILAEKPLADSVALAESYVADAGRAGVPLTVGLNFRYLAATRALKGLFTPDRLGRPEFGRFTYERWRDGRQPRLNKYPLTMAQPMLWEQSIHHFDLMRFVYDADPVSIHARTFNPSWSMYRGDANVAALITFTGGLEVTYQGTWAGNWQKMTFDWRTETPVGVAIQADMFGAVSFARRDDAALTAVALPVTEPWVDDAAALLADFVDALMHGRPVPCSGADHVISLRMVEACIASSTSGHAIDPRTLSFERTHSS